MVSLNTETFGYLSGTREAYIPSYTGVFRPRKRLRRSALSYRTDPEESNHDAVVSNLGSAVEVAWLDFVYS